MARAPSRRRRPRRGSSVDDSVGSRRGRWSLELANREIGADRGERTRGRELQGEGAEGDGPNRLAGLSHTVDWRAAARSSSGTSREQRALSGGLLSLYSSRGDSSRGDSSSSSTAAAAAAAARPTYEYLSWGWPRWHGSSSHRRRSGMCRTASTSISHVSVFS